MYLYIARYILPSNQNPKYEGKWVISTAKMVNAMSATTRIMMSFNRTELGEQSNEPIRLPGNKHTIRLKNMLVMLFTRGQFWPSGIAVASVCLSVCLCVRQSLACPRDNLSPVQARITKFGPEEQNTLVKIPIVLGVNWPWTSRSNLT